VELVSISDRTIATLMNEFPEFVLEMLRDMAVRLRETSRLVV
jgi:CRP-like cAMP-binding protein